MADKKISALTSATTPLAGTEVLPIVQGGSTVKVEVNDMLETISVTSPAVNSEGNIFLRATDSLAAGIGTQIGLGGKYNASSYFPFGGISARKENSTSNNVAGYTDILTTTSGGTLTPRMRFNSTGDGTLLNGNFVVGTAGKGIDFSANTHAAGMTSELLDWYEEGTWTPTDASGAGLSFVAVSGNYTRIGNTVFLFGYVRYPVTVTTNTARIGGLPFTANSADSVTQGAVTYSQVATIRSVGVAKSTAILDIYTLAGGVPTNADLSNTVLYFNSTYFV